jgi:hypothetical protein
MHEEGRQATAGAVARSSGTRPAWGGGTRRPVSDAQRVVALFQRQVWLRRPRSWGRRTEHVVRLAFETPAKRLFSLVYLALRRVLQLGPLLALHVMLMSLRCRNQRRKALHLLSGPAVDTSGSPRDFILTPSLTPESPVPPDTVRASCALCDWTTTGSPRRVCAEQARHRREAHGFVTEQEPAETGARQAARAAAVRAAWHLGRGRGTLRDEAADSGSNSHGRPEDRAGRARRRRRLVANISRALL